MVPLNIGIYYHSLENIGGIERVILELSRIFNENSDNIVLITSQPIVFLQKSIDVPSECLSKGNNRDSELDAIITQYRLDWLIVHDPSDEYLDSTISVAHKNKCKVALMIHFSFPSPIIFNEANHLYETVIHKGGNADAIACVSQLDTLCWRSLGLPAFYVQNPFVHKNISDDTSERKPNTNIVWIGRGVPQKKPLAALRILQLIVSRMPDVILTMVGIGASEQILLKEAQQLGVVNNLRLVRGTDNVHPFYQTASVHLLTSVTESFCLVIAEAKEQGLPTVMFEIPFLELTKSGEGVVVHPQDDYQSMADSIVTLLSDHKLLKTYSDAAKASLEEFNDKAVMDSWNRLFHGKVMETDYRLIQASAIPEMINAWKIHIAENKWKIDFCDNMNKISCSFFKKAVTFCSNRIFPVLIKLKRKIK